MDFLDDPSARASAADFTQQLSVRVVSALGNKLLGIYQIGSLVHGGFSRRYSDVDVAFTVDGVLSESDQEQIRSAAAVVSEEWAGKLSIFWADRSFAQGRFPPLDRADYVERPGVLWERERVAARMPSLTEVRNYLAGRPLTSWFEAVERIIGLEMLDRRDHKPVVRANLYPARFAYSWLTGKMASNDDAVAFLRAEGGLDFDLRLIDMAMDCRLRAADPVQLFDERRRLGSQVSVCKKLVATKAAE